MASIDATRERNNTEQLAVPSAEQTVAVVPSSAELERLTARRRGAKAGFAKHLFAGVDLNGLLDTSLDDVFEGYR